MGTETRGFDNLLSKGTRLLFGQGKEGGGQEEFFFKKQENEFPSLAVCQNTFSFLLIFSIQHEPMSQLLGDNVRRENLHA